MSVAQLTSGRPAKTAVRGAKKDWLFRLSIVVFSLVALCAAFGPLLTPYDPRELYSGDVNGIGSLLHPFGTDDVGRDILSRALEGARASVVAPIAIVGLSTILGAGIAIVGAWFGGLVSAAIDRVIDVIFAIPGLVLAVLAVAMFGKGLSAPIIALSIAYVPVVARLTRTAASRELGKPYMAALRIQGVGSLAICFRHLVPALVPVLMAQMTVGFGYAMLDLAAISILGLGQQPPNADWGSMIASGQNSILAGAPEQSLYPALLVVVTVLSVSIIGARITTWAEKKEQ